MSKRPGERTHPCLTPHCILCESLLSPATLTAARWLQDKFLIILMPYPSSFKLFSISSRSSCLKLSKAFSKSKKQNNFFCTYIGVSAIIRSDNTAFAVPLLLTKLKCCSDISGETLFLILFYMTHNQILVT